MEEKIKSILTKLIKVSCLTSLLSFAATSYAQQTNSQFLALADIHFDPFSYCSSNVIPCTTLQKLIAGNPTAPAQDPHSWEAILHTANEQMPQNISALGQDTNENLLDVTLAYLKNLKAPYDFVTLNGDFIAHDFAQQFEEYAGIANPGSPEYELQYQLFVRKTFEYINYRLQQTFPHTSIYITLGNNDSYIDDYVYAPDRREPESFYHQMVQVWSPSILDTANRASFGKTFGLAGYYAITIPQGDAHFANKMIFLNTNLYSAMNTQGHGSRVPLAAQQQLIWLKIQLQQLRKAGGHAILVYHIPNGADNYKSSRDRTAVMLWGTKNDHYYNDEFTQIVAQYHDVITEAMTAHFHMDGYQFLRIAPAPRATVLDTFDAGISPNNKSNPGFKIYTYDPKTLQLLDFKTYYMNDLNNNAPGPWKLDYDFNALYQPTCYHKSNCFLSTGYQKIPSDHQALRTQAYIQLYPLQAKGQPINKGAWMPYYWCATQYQLDAEYAACLQDPKDKIRSLTGNYLAANTP